MLIGTPGRLIDYFKQHIFSLRHVQVLVLDEADRMFDLGFIKDIRFVLRRLPPFDKRLNLLFSATLSYRVLELAYEHMNDPHLVQIEPDKKTVDRVTQAVYFPANHEKPALLIGLMQRMQATRTMVFVNTKREAEHVGAVLTANGIGAAAISGDVPQPKRLRMLRISRPAACRCWWPPTSPPAACMCPTSATSSTTTCRRMRRTTCTGSAARPAPAPAAMPSASPARATPSPCPRSRPTSATVSRWARSTRASCWK